MPIDDVVEGDWLGEDWIDGVPDALKLLHGVHPGQDGIRMEKSGLHCIELQTRFALYTLASRWLLGLSENHQSICTSYGSKV